MNRRRRAMNLNELRERAERAIADGQSSLAAALDEPSSLELTHLIEELRIYQAELELQNEELNQAQDQLAQAKERYRRLFDDLPVPALVVDGNGFIAEINAQGYQILGLSPQASLRRWAFARFFMPADADRLLLHLSTLEAAAPLVRLESMHLKADGGIACYDLHLMSLHPDPGGDDWQALVVFIDRSPEEALKTLSAELARAKLLAEQASAAKSTFLAKIGHELRTPLNALLGLSSLLLEEKGSLSAWQEDYLTKINAAAEALASLISDILDDARFADSGLKFDAIALSIEDLLTNTRRLFAPLAEAKGLRFECLADPRIPDLLIGDPLRIQQVLNHLVDNALKFTEHGGVRVWVEQQNQAPSSAAPTVGPNDPLSPGQADRPPLRPEAKDMLPAASAVCWIRFTVSDTGLGLEREQLAHLWSAPLPEDPSVSQVLPRIGRGLTISRRLVERMGGRIGVDSKLGHGSVFYFELPLSIPLSMADIATQAQPGSRSGPADQSVGALSEPLDLLALQTRFKQLGWLLDHQLSRARVLSAEIEQSLQGTYLQDEYSPIAQAIRQLDFAAALTALQRLAARQGWLLS